MTKRRLNVWASATAVAVAAAVLLWRPQAVATGVSRGLSVCGDVLVPALFPFLVLGRFLIASGVAAAVGRRLEGVTRTVFGLPGCCAAGIVIAFLGGYPAGGNVVGELVRRGDISTAEGRRMLRFCVNGGPGFMLGVVGTGLTGSVSLGVILLLANLAASLLLGVVGVPREARKKQRCFATQKEPLPPGVALVEAVSGACDTVVSMCGFVLLFSAVSAVVDASGVAEWVGRTPSGAKMVGAVIACLLEVCGGCVSASSLGSAAALFLGFAVGFGGLSVHCQLAAALNGLGLVDTRFVIARAAQGGLTALFTVLLLRWIPVTLPVFGAWQRPVTLMSSGSAAVSVTLLLLLGIWMLTVGDRLDKADKTPYNKRQ